MSRSGRRRPALAGAPVIRVRGLRCRAHIGVPASEQRRRQELRVDLELEYDSRAAARGDEWPAALDYQALTDSVVALVEGTRVKLIEAMAERIASHVLEDSRVLRVRVELAKPAALERARRVCAVLHRERAPHAVVIALGSNIDPEQSYARALALLREELEVVAESAPVRTRPRELADQPEFLNGALLARTPRSRLELKRRLRAIETALGRDRSGPRAGPRSIDLDIVVWCGEVVDSHVREWDFLRRAVAELLPELELGSGPA